MDCKEIQYLIPAFAQNQLTLKEEEIFVNHVADCRECKEELEIYYIMGYGLSDDDIDTDYNSEEFKKLIQIYDFKGLVEYKLNSSKHTISKSKKTQNYIRTAFVMLETCLLSACILYMIYIFN